ncbi:unnamed protein product [Mytilus edulis]|uniref:Novel STAND NTPase 3 domain-containing protein n=1 Tax=Mytilus edulis TaxID=6550 RepID=A0A8S3V427_MYTED|nr:unnamed protein product [Mytilus edulis]
MQVLVIPSWKISEAVFLFQCPVQAHWKLRADTYCDSLDNYFCLYDRKEKKFTEFCRKSPDVEVPGYKLIVAGSLQGDICEPDFYQPFKFSSIGNSRCVYKQPYCSEKGQIVYRNGTEKNASSCRCDYTKGFNFITNPRHQCYCKPLEEDCSCFHKTCPSDYILSPDYKCIHILYGNEGDTRFSCESISTVLLPKDPEIASSTDNPVLEYDVLELQKEILLHWSNVLNKFVLTKAAQLLYQQIQTQNVIAIIGPTGTGKSATAYQIAFKLKNEYNYTIVPARQPSDILQYYVPGTNQVFVIDDFIGKYAFDEAEGISWEKIGPLLQKMLSNNDQTKVILTCRKSIWLPEKYERFGFSALVCDLRKKSWD